MDSNRVEMRPGEVFRVPTNVTRPSSRGACWDRGPNHRAGVPLTNMGSSRALVPGSPLANMSRINEFLGQPRNDLLCAAVEFWRGSLSQGT
jgi:hypothetical protein